MMGLLVFKERLKTFYAKNSGLVIPIVKFVIAVTAFFMINKNAGFMPKVTNSFVPVILALVSACLPYGAIAFLAGGFLLIQLYSASLEVAVITLVFLLIVIFLYYGFQPGDSVLLLLTPILFFLKIPFAVPLVVGLAGGLVSVIPMSCGIFLYYVILYVKQNTSFLAGGTQIEMTQVFAQVVKSIMGNQTMLVMMAAFCLTVLVVHIVKNFSMNYSWGIAITAGVIVQLVAIFIGDFKFNITVSVPSLIIGIAISAFIAVIYHFFVFAVDYTRTEYLQFEDDDYYYYVKAVPKITVTKPDVKVQKINTRRTPMR